MKIGVISDTHDNIPAVIESFKYFEKNKIKMVLHLGDIISPFVIRFIRKVYTGELKAIFGNNDGEKLFLMEMFKQHNAEVTVGPRIIQLAKRRIFMSHEPISPETLAKDYNLVLYGHLHETHSKRFTNSLILNPGEACGYLSNKRTLAVVDLVTLDFKIVEF